MLISKYKYKETLKKARPKNWVIRKTKIKVNREIVKSLINLFIFFFQFIESFDSIYVWSLIYASIVFFVQLHESAQLNASIVFILLYLLLEIYFIYRHTDTLNYSIFFCLIFFAIVFRTLLLFTRDFHF